MFRQEWMRPQLKLLMQQRESLTAALNRFVTTALLFF